MKKKSVIIAILVVIVLIIVVSIIVGNNKKKIVDVPNTTIEGNKATGEVSVEEIQFKEITKVYEEGITTIRAKMYNTTDTVKNVTIKIILKDEQGNELKNMVQVVENLLPNREKVLSTGIAGDYTSVKDIKFEIVK